MYMDRAQYEETNDLTKLWCTKEEDLKLNCIVVKKYNGTELNR